MEMKISFKSNQDLFLLYTDSSDMLKMKFSGGKQQKTVRIIAPGD